MALTNFGEVKSGDLLEIELTIDSKNDYEHLDLRGPESGRRRAVRRAKRLQCAVGLPAYVELRDEKVNLFLRDAAPRQAQPALPHAGGNPRTNSARCRQSGSGMYAPELKANSDEMKLRIGESR